ncbi:MAG: MATE family efflux transporter [Butyrivibrio sp.]|nr:MATE family efflux transporter [Butyrivibrio sp.]
MELDMTKGKPFPIILKFMFPLFLGNLFQQLYNMVDTIIVGRYVSENALAAVGSTGTIMFLVLGFSQGLTTGFTVLTAQSFGAGDMKRVKRSVANGIILSAIVIVAMTIISVAIMDFLLRLMNTPEDIFDDAKTYIVTICYGIVASVSYNLFSSFLRAIGNSKVPLYFLMFSAGLNVIFDLIFIIGLNMGVMGAALATDISQGISAIGCVLYIIKKAPLLWPDSGDWHLNSKDTSHQMGVGMPMALQFGITASGTMIMQSAINLFGSTAVAAYTAASKLNNLLTQGFPAMGQTMATYCGQNYGKGDFERIHKGVKSALLTSTAYSIIGAGLAIILLPHILGIFFDASVDISVMMPYAKPYVYLCIMFYIPLGFIFIFRNAMQGCGYGLLPMLGGFVELFSRLIMAAAAIKTMNYILAAACDPSAWLTTGIFTGVCYIFVIRDVTKKMQANKIENTL